MLKPVCKYCGSNDILELEDAAICRRIVGINDDGATLLSDEEETRSLGGVIYECAHCWRIMTSFSDIQPVEASPIPIESGQLLSLTA